jgi:hypothetical protein
MLQEGPLVGIAEGLAALRAARSASSAWLEYQRAGQIQITSPLNGGVLEDKQAMLDGFSYLVRGTLKRLPKDNAIWLLNEDLPGRVWPQGFSEGIVKYPYPREGEWEGRVFATSSQVNVSIFAVVAPPTSRDFFAYYQKWVSETKADPLGRIPVECTNRAQVRARQPTTAG